MPTVCAGALFDGEELRRDVAVELDDAGVVLVVRPIAAGDPQPVDGVVIPGLVNAHLHLELSHLVGRVPGGDGLVRWVGRLLVERGRATDDVEAAMRAAAAAMVAAGTAAVYDIANAPGTAAILAEAGLQGIVGRELLGLDARGLPSRLQAAAEPDERVGPIAVRPIPHALYSTAPALVRASVGRDAPERAPASIHLAEDHDELSFVQDGTGRWADFLDRMKVEWRWWEAPGTSPAAMLNDLGVLGPGLLCVHGVHLSPHDRALLARTGSPVVLCPRSNLHIGGETADAGALRQAGVATCLGTDSLASAPDLDVLGEVPALVERFAAVPTTEWLRLATSAGADALRLRGLGRIAPGRGPGLLRLGVDHVDEIRVVPPPERTWLVRPARPVEA